MSTVILSIENLSKQYRSHWTFRPLPALSGVSLQVFAGESFGFLGHNGAGKTTTIKCIASLLRPTSGRILFEGKVLDSPEQHSGLGYLPELPYFYEHLSVQETLDFFAGLHSLRGPIKRQRVDEVLARVGLADRRRAMVRSLSKGLQQRLGFAQALLNHPRLLLLDEPFSGLDPVGRREMRELLFELKSQGTTLFLSSHILSDVAEICDRVAIMAKGELKTVFALQDIPRLFGQLFEVSFILPRSSAAESKTSELSLEASSIRDRSSVAGAIRVLQFTDYEAAQRALRAITALDIQLLEFQSVGPKLEDVFLKITENATPQEQTSEPQVLLAERVDA